MTYAQRSPTASSCLINPSSAILQCLYENGWTYLDVRPTLEVDQVGKVKNSVNVPLMNAKYQYDPESKERVSRPFRQCPACPRPAMCRHCPACLRLTVCAEAVTGARE
jgi:hypothetical protein